MRDAAVHIGVVRDGERAGFGRVLSGKVVVERAAVCDVDDLEAAADAQDGHVPALRLGEQMQFDVIACGRGLVHCSLALLDSLLVKGERGAVAGGIDVGTAREHKAAYPVEQIIVDGEVAAERGDYRQAACHDKGVRVVLR